MNGRLLSIRESGHNHIVDVSRISCLFLRTADSFLVIAIFGCKNKLCNVEDYQVIGLRSQ